MSRIAILIGSPLPKPHLEGVEYDLTHMKKFLMSEIGGSWESGEIHSIFMGTKAQIEVILNECTKHDFSLVYFSGHGFTDNEGRANVWVNNTEIMLVKDLANLTNKQITIIDACRDYSEESEFTGLSGIGTMDAVGLGNSKSVFENYLKQCSNGRVLLFASQKGQSSKDMGRGYGGFFSMHLLKASVKSAKESPNKIISIASVFNETYPKVQHLHQPDIEYNDKNAPYLPFAVKPTLSLPIKKQQNSIKFEDVALVGLGVVAFVGATALLVDLLTGDN